ncbi:hypothetical protein HMPREF9123_1691 [Neisseria bacilliformis ATCC BAA-1200]|uniref:Uncharacterized protein n=1 Tax=Neisseria bacilliformis ATCC BAA-1200 TaxID=888742 RepID=F2BD85_9NEIS|nr:hypothetical protein HMPREF9123_1691 [Neisseria bacilliformis ATCC BAA-1200]
MCKAKKMLRRDIRASVRLCQKRIRRHKLPRQRKRPSEKTVFGFSDGLLCPY